MSDNVKLILKLSAVGIAAWIFLKLMLNILLVPAIAYAGYLCWKKFKS